MEQVTLPYETRTYRDNEMVTLEYVCTLWKRALWKQDREKSAKDDDDDYGHDDVGDDDDDAVQDVGLAEDRLADIWSLSTLNMHGTAFTALCFGAKWGWWLLRLMIDDAKERIEMEALVNFVPFVSGMAQLLIT